MTNVGARLSTDDVLTTFIFTFSLTSVAVCYDEILMKSLDLMGVKEALENIK